MLGMEPVLAICKASALPSVLLLQPPFMLFVVTSLAGRKIELTVSRQISLSPPPGYQHGSLNGRDDFETNFNFEHNLLKTEV